MFTIQEYLTYRIGIWEKIKTETASIIAAELRVVQSKV